MKRVLVLLCITLCMFYKCNDVNAVGSIYVTIDNDISGDIGYEVIDNDIDKTTIVLTLHGDDTATFNTDIVGDNVNDWFYIPLDIDEELIPNPFNELVNGLDAYVLEVNDNEVIIEIIGIVSLGNEIGERLICVAIPSEAILIDEEEYLEEEYIFTNLELSSGLYKIYEPLIQYKGAYTVSGTVGEDLIPQIVVVTLNENSLLKFDPTVALNKDLDIVNGLLPTISEVSDKELTITYTGIPINVSNDLIHTTIIKDYLIPSTLDKVVPDRIDVKFDINEKEVVIVEEKVEFMIPKTCVD